MIIVIIVINSLQQLVGIDHIVDFSKVTYRAHLQKKINHHTLVRDYTTKLFSKY